jgi:hypothetical protein
MPEKNTYLLNHHRYNHPPPAYNRSLVHSLDCKRSVHLPGSRPRCAGRGKLNTPNDWSFSTNGRVWIDQNWGLMSFSIQPTPLAAKQDSWPSNFCYWH